MFTEGTGQRVMSISSDPVATSNDASLRVYDNDFSGGQAQSITLEDCEDGDTRCHTGSNIIDTCVSGVWAPLARNCSAGKVCSLYTSNCEVPAIVAVFPDNLVVSKSDERRIEITVDFNAKVDGTLSVIDPNEKVQDIPFRSKSRIEVELDPSALALYETKNYTFVFGNDIIAKQWSVNLTLIP
ncbi:MAG: hypothetical protein WC966_01080 [Bradymonadales bacterium]